MIGLKNQMITVYYHFYHLITTHSALYDNVFKDYATVCVNIMQPHLSYNQIVRIFCD